MDAFILRMLFRLYNRNVSDAVHAAFQILCIVHDSEGQEEMCLIYDVLG